MRRILTCAMIGAKGVQRHSTRNKHNSVTVVLFSAFSELALCDFRAASTGPWVPVGEGANRHGGLALTRARFARWRPLWRLLARSLACRMRGFDPPTLWPTVTRLRGQIAGRWRRRYLPRLCLDARPGVSQSSFLYVRRAMRVSSLRRRLRSPSRRALSRNASLRPASSRFGMR